MIINDRTLPRFARRAARIGLAALLLVVVAGCQRSATVSQQGDRSAAQRAAAAEARSQSQGPSGVQTPNQASLLTTADLTAAYRFILDSFVDRPDYAGVIEAGRVGLRDQLAEGGALPADYAALDLLPMATGNPDRDWAAFSTAVDAVVQRHGEWALQSRPDYVVVRKMLDSLNDNHSTFVTADDTRRRAETAYSGIGVRIARPDPRDAPVVVEVFQASPAAGAGIRVGDRIRLVGDRDVSGLDLTDVAGLIRGPQGSEIELQLERTAAGGRFTVRAARRSIDTPQADGQLLEPRIGYIKIRSFGDTVAERVGRLLLEQRQAGAQGWIVDLRGNPGGNLTSVARVAGYFMDVKPIGISVDRNGQRETISAEQRPFIVRAPLVVLVDGDSGSGSEVLASAFQGYQLAPIVGQRTAGSVGIANVRQLSDGSTVQVTVRRLLSASGGQLDRVGVQPDQPATLTIQDLEAGRDPQRDQAIEVLRQRLRGA